MRFLARRFLFYMAALVVAITINFLIPRMMTGDPVQLIIARFQGRIEPSAVDAIKATFGFIDGPLPEQFGLYINNLLHGNLGISVMNFPVPVSDVIGSGIAWTLRLVGLATITANRPPSSLIETTCQVS